MDFISVIKSATITESNLETSLPSKFLVMGNERTCSLVKVVIFLPLKPSILFGDSPFLNLLQRKFKKDDDFPDNALERGL